MIRLRVLGALDLRAGEDGHAVRSVLAQPKRLALLCRLALARPPGFRQREELLGLFWPELHPERARRALNQALSYLRRGLGEGVILTRNAGEVGVDRERLWCDAAVFDARLEAGDVEEALELYEGHLLEAFYVAGCRGFERWVEEERERLRRLAVEAALDLAEQRESEGNGVGAIHRARQAVGWAPYDERALRRLMKLLEAYGDVAGSLRTYEAFAARLASELEAGPAVETQALAERLRSAPGGDVAPVAGGKTPTRAVSPTAFSEGRDRTRTAGLRVVAGGLVLLAAAVAAASLLDRAGPSRTLSESREVSSATAELDLKRVLVAPFRNRTGRPELDVLGPFAADWVVQGLARAGGLSVVAPLYALREGRRELTTERRTQWPDLALARRAGAGTLVEGYYADEGGLLLVDVRLVDVATGEVLHALEPVWGSGEASVELVQVLRDRIAAAVGNYLDPALEPWTSSSSSLPPSVAAYRLYSEGMELFLAAPERPTTRGRPTMLVAAERFLEAGRVDSGFSAPLVWAAWARLNAGDAAGATLLVDSLQSIRPALPPFERAAVDHLRARTEGDWEAAYRASRAMVAMAPTSDWRIKLATAARKAGRPREALNLFLQLAKAGSVVATSDRFGYSLQRVWARHWLGDHAAELRDVRAGLELAEHRERVPADDPKLRYRQWQEVAALAALGREEELADHVSTYKHRPSRWYLRALALGELRGHGHPGAAARLLRAYLPAATALARSDSALGEEIGHFQHPFHNLEAVLLAGERWQEARRVLERRAEAAGPEAGRELPIARAWLQVVAIDRGERGEAREVERWLRDYPPWTSPPSPLPTVLRAAILAHLGELEAATALLREVPPVWAHASHTYYWLEPLRGFAPYEALLEPRG